VYSNSSAILVRCFFDAPVKSAIVGALRCKRSSSLKYRSLVSFLRDMPAI